ncbi:RecX family transcriptional regulator [Candidatus Saccharibacteria bacterium]|nr:RecX family transcriptional regulator [Candidatus Saccharibacteria bacterium]
MIITNLKQGVKNPNRVNVFVDGKFEFSLDITQVVDYKLKVGKELTVKEFDELKKASEFGKLYQRTLEWVLTRPRSEKEVRDYLVRKLKTSSSGRSSLPSSRGSSLRPRSNCGCPSEDIFQFSQAIIDRLITKGYLDDRKFAEWYVQNRFVKKGVSRKRLQMELMKKGISREIIDEVLNARNDEEEILKIIAKKRTKYTDEKLIQYLCRQGFSYELVRNLVQTYEKD